MNQSKYPRILRGYISAWYKVLSSCIQVVETRPPCKKMRTETRENDIALGLEDPVPNTI